LLRNFVSPTIGLLTVVFALWICAPVVLARAAERPNIVLILADDMGYGDVHAQNPTSRLPTPHLDRLAGQGMRFTDAHSPSAVCTPTRYGLLTGRYCWRSSLKSGVLGGYSPPLIEVDRPTIATMLQAAGYQTAAIGKWHLGMTLPRLGEEVNTSVWEGDPGIDFAGRISDSPIHYGFDYYFGVTASLDMAPYVYVRNDRFTMAPTKQQPAVKFPHFVRAGPRAEDFVIDQVLDKLAAEAIDFIERAAEDERPFFLYLPLTAPHKPTQPHERFRGRTGLGEYGDFVAQVDDAVGRVLAAVEDAGEADHTMVIFSSDNGSYMFRYDEANRTDHVDDPTIQAYRADRHRANGPLRGTKADIWEGGHRVPLLVRWPGRVRAESTCDEPVCLTDLFATCGEIVGAKLADGSAEDSYSFWPLLEGKDAKRGAPVVHHSAAGMFALRDGRWKLILGNGSGGRQAPRGKPFTRPYQFFDLSNDPAETYNVAEQHPDVVERLIQMFEGIRQNGRGATGT
jgi:arylsulfatase A-like enzyme